MFRGSPLKACSVALLLRSSCPRLLLPKDQTRDTDRFLLLRGSEYRHVKLVRCNSFSEILRDFGCTLDRERTWNNNVTHGTPLPVQHYNRESERRSGSSAKLCPAGRSTIFHPAARLGRFSGGSKPTTLGFLSGYSEASGHLVSRSIPPKKHAI